MSSASEESETRQTWRIRFAAELMKRGGTDEARQKMIDETPDWLRQILDIPLRFGDKPLWCTCAKWYMDGTHHKDCLHLKKEAEKEKKA